MSDKSSATTKYIRHLERMVDRLTDGNNTLRADNSQCECLGLRMEVRKLERELAHERHRGNMLAERMKELHELSK